MAGKGDKPRPINKKRYDDNYSKINWEIRICESCKWECKIKGYQNVRCPYFKEAK